MKHLLITLGLAGLMATVASAGVVSYNTNTSTLSCGAVSGCTQNNSQSVTVGGLTLTYNPGTGTNVNANPSSIINLGNIVSTGTGSNVNLTGLLLTIIVSSTPPGTNGSLPTGTVTGTLSTNQSNTTIGFSPNNTFTAAFGSLPGVVIAAPSGAPSFTYQVLQTTLGLQAPTVGTPVGQTSIQGGVTDTSVPEPTTMVLMGAGLGVLGLLRRRAAR